MSPRLASASINESRKARRVSSLSSATNSKCSNHYGRTSAGEPTIEKGCASMATFQPWPPTQGMEPRRLYLRHSGRLSFDPPVAAGAACDEYVSDPSNPVPYRPRPITPTFTGPGWPVWLVQDQRFLDRRRTFSPGRPILSQTPSTSPEIFVAELYASTTGTDADRAVKLTMCTPKTLPKMSPPTRAWPASSSLSPTKFCAAVSGRAMSAPSRRLAVKL